MKFTLWVIYLVRHLSILYHKCRNIFPIPFAKTHCQFKNLKSPLSLTFPPLYVKIIHIITLCTLTQVHIYYYLYYKILAGGMKMNKLKIPQNHSGISRTLRLPENIVDLTGGDP